MCIHNMFSKYFPNIFPMFTIFSDIFHISPIFPQYLANMSPIFPQYFPICSRIFQDFRLRKALRPVQTAATRCPGGEVRKRGQPERCGGDGDGGGAKHGCKGGAHRGGLSMGTPTQWGCLFEKIHMYIAILR